MAFFGLTALGSQNEFAASSKFKTYINVFEDKDFEAVWKRSVGDSKHCLSSKLPSMMETLYRGNVPENVCPNPYIILYLRYLVLIFPSSSPFHIIPNFFFASCVPRFHHA